MMMTVFGWMTYTLMMWIGRMMILIVIGGEMTMKSRTTMKMMNCTMIPMMISETVFMLMKRFWQQFKMTMACTKYL